MNPFCGLHMLGARFYKHLLVKLAKLGFHPTKADPDLWIRKHAEGHYKYIAQFVDDVAAFAKDPLSIMKN